MHILNIYKINCIWDTCTCTQNISRGAAYICSSLINSMQNAICQLHCRRPHVCPEMDQVENSNPRRLPWPRLHRLQYRASRSPAASPLTQTPGKKMGRTLTIESCCTDLLNNASMPVCILLKLSSFVFLVVSHAIKSTSFFSSQFCLFQGGNTSVVLTNLVPFK